MVAPMEDGGYNRECEWWFICMRFCDVLNKWLDGGHPAIYSVHGSMTAWIGFSGLGCVI